MKLRMACLSIVVDDVPAQIADAISFDFKQALSYNHTAISSLAEHSSASY